jgi:diguanylate cyclase (GGDEF)-like protein/PAS domain S-box-containing protein
MKKKLILLLLTTIVLTLSLVGISLNHLISQHYQENANEDFQILFSQLGKQLQNYKQVATLQARNLANDEDLVSSVNMIHQYARHDNYQPLVFDGEKRTLAKHFAAQAAAAHVEQIAVYTTDGNLVSLFNVLAEPVTGYLSYNKENTPIFFYYHKETNSWKETTSLPSSAIEPGLISRIEKSRFHFLGKHLAIETSTPVIRSFPDGKNIHVGNVVVSKLIDENFAKQVSKGTEMELSILHSIGSRIGQLTDITLEQAAHNPELQLYSGMQEFRGIPHDKYFLAGTQLTISKEGTSSFLAALPKAHVSETTARTNTAVILVLLIAAILIFPIGIIAANRAITRPVNQLLSGVQAMRKGDYSVHIYPTDRNELGMLAIAFNGMVGDIQERTQELVESESKYRTLLENVPQKIFYKDTNSIFVSCNNSFANDVGLRPEEIAGKTDYDFFPKELAEKYRADDQQVMITGELADFDERYVQGDQEFCVHTVKTPVQDSHGQCIGILGVFWDITEQQRTEQRLKQSAAVFENTAEGVIITDTQPRIIAVNRAFTEITGFTEEEVLGKPPNIRRSGKHDSDFYQALWDSLNQTDRWRGEIWNRRKNGEINPEWMTISAVYDDQGEISNYVAVFTDITAIKTSEAKLEYLAHHDPLTNLPNRLVINDRITHAVERSQRSGQKVAVLFLDLDRFKNINDTLGHPVGDQLLQEASNRIRTALRQGDTLGRLGGDEFIVVIEEFDHINEVEHTAEKLLHTMTAPFSIQQHELYLGVSIGISLFPDDGSEVATLIRNADTAMYRAKEQGRNNFHFYTSDMTAEATERLSLESALRHAVEGNELLLHYQPQIDLTSRKIIGAEALVRWQHREHGLIPPDKFIPLAEETNLILQIGEWVLKTACQQTVQWLKDGMQLQQISVNISSIQVQRGNLVKLVQKTLDETGLDPAMLELEITESVLMSNPEFVKKVLGELRALGVGLAVDDFGTGYSSLSYLKSFPLNSLKIDRSFVRDLPDDKDDEAITKAVIALGHTMQLRIVAEGVETQAQQDFLINQGCELAQGYFYSRPVPADEFSRQTITQ